MCRSSFGITSIVGKKVNFALLRWVGRRFDQMRLLFLCITRTALGIVCRLFETTWQWSDWRFSRDNGLKGVSGMRRCG